MKEMSFIEHLEELRSTLVRVVIILAIGFFICYGIGEYLTEILLKPVRDILLDDVQGKIVYLSVFDKVLAQFQLAFWSGIILSSPLWFYEVWKFIAPGLYPHEVKVVRPFLLVGFVLFALGILFGYFIAFPLAFETLMKFGVGDVEATISLREYLSQSAKILVLLGFLFQLPNILLILGFMGLVTKYSLKNIRRYVYFALAVFSALLTPSDVVTMLGLWVPMVGLYELGIIAVALIVHPYLAKRNS